MYEEYVSKLNPRPKMNLTWYEGEDKYSDGNVEDLIAKIVSENEPEDYVDAIGQCFNWATFVHLIPIRRNIFNWYPFKKDSSALEIGCGMGALTGALCEACGKVTAVEMSLRRATTTQIRCREYDNLEIIVGNLNDIEFTEKFDYITLIGVLEYQGTYTDSANPYLDFLKKLKSLLKPDGKLLVAIENRFGIKYWCGAREDHTATPFDGINGYISNSLVRTFSRKGLEKLVKEAGFNNSFFYYPMPDYKIPRTIFSEKRLPTKGKYSDMMPYSTNPTSMVANESELYDEIIENNTFEFFANSFLVECTDDDVKERAIYARMPVNRQKEYQIGVRINSDDTVDRFPLTADAKTHIKTILANERMIDAAGLDIIMSEEKGDSIRQKLCKAPMLESVLAEAITRQDVAKVFELLDKVKNELEKSSEEADWKDNILYEMGLDAHKGPEYHGKILKNGFNDMTFSNAFIDEKGITWFDQEWRMENVPVNYILYRAVSELYASHPEISQGMTRNVLYEYLGLKECIEEYSQYENLFMQTVTDIMALRERQQFEYNARPIIERNINALIHRE